ncbi:hypothetical protein BmR1_04g07310 [Babesia microti strain RI]|uniref:Uncharacterized protein n=1 Tax=Babesia microti (strain RI) TaxID=1133968 RepID=I7I9U6_BABMR|nr:hypothetical protein BmR1_04g07310 [Babesia microti strain RI]CCF75654.1 hypothetical protein BmR1_04g07310 [Babesia microti strain RI]|eukprot:XP_012650062.1 hypothetical protein BmR1_04g07310 [Babesia microti strain RI]
MRDIIDQGICSWGQAILAEGAKSLHVTPSGCAIIAS